MREKHTKTSQQSNTTKSPAALDQTRDGIKRSQQIADEIRRDIITGVIRPGDTLNESQLAQRFRCSQAPVREACVALNHEWFLSNTPYKGFAVREMTMSEIKELYEVRLLTECSTAEMAARNVSMDDKYLEEMEQSVEIQRMGIGPEKTWEFLKAEVDFHVALARASQNQILERFVFLIWGRFQLFYYKTLSLRKSKSDPETADEHAAIAAAVRGSEPEKAGDLMRQHILLGRETALKIYFGL